MRPIQQMRCEGVSEFLVVIFSGCRIASRPSSAPSGPPSSAGGSDARPPSGCPDSDCSLEDPATARPTRGLPTGYFRASASGIGTRPRPESRSRRCCSFTQRRCALSASCSTWGSGATRSLPPFPRRTTISPRPKSIVLHAELEDLVHAQTRAVLDLANEHRRNLRCATGRAAPPPRSGRPDASRAAGPARSLRGVRRAAQKHPCRGTGRPPAPDSASRRTRVGSLPDR